MFVSCAIVAASPCQLFMGKIDAAKQLNILPYEKIQEQDNQLHSRRGDLKDIPVRLSMHLDK